MSYAIGVAKHPTTGEKALVVQAHPEPWTAPAVLNLLRTIKKNFPQEFRDVHYEMVIAADAKSSLVIPDDIGGSPG